MTQAKATATTTRADGANATSYDKEATTTVTVAPEGHVLGNSRNPGRR